MTGTDMRDGSGRPRLQGAEGMRVRDVADFQSRWDEFRPHAKEALHKPGLTPAESDTLAWMVEVMDRIGPRDMDAATGDTSAPDAGGI